MLSTGFEEDKSEKTDRMTKLEETIQRQQEALDTLGAALKEEQENRRALETFSKKAIEANTENDELAAKKADSGVAALQKDVAYLEQILRAEVKARLQVAEETKERTDSLVARVVENGRVM